MRRRKRLQGLLIRAAAAPYSAATPHSAANAREPPYFVVLLPARDDAATPLPRGVVAPPSPSPSPRKTSSQTRYSPATAARRSHGRSTGAPAAPPTTDLSHSR